MNRKLFHRFRRFWRKNYRYIDHQRRQLVWLRIKQYIADYFIYSNLTTLLIFLSLYEGSTSMKRVLLGTRSPLRTQKLGEANWYLESSFYFMTSYLASGKVRRRDENTYQFSRLKSLVYQLLFCSAHTRCCDKNSGLYRAIKPFVFSTHCGSKRSHLYSKKKAHQFFFFTFTFAINNTSPI